LLYWVLRPWRQAFDFRGRATRREYWFFLVQLYTAFILAVLILGLVGAIAFPSEIVAGMASVLAGTVTSVLVLMMMIPYVSASIRRLHDHDKSGWLFLLAMVPGVGWIFFLIMMLTPGTQGPNSYGSDPRDRLETDEDVSKIFS
jgi:uncharacterized membrane protein YhaH (DUF805 family)